MNMSIIIVVLFAAAFFMPRSKLLYWGIMFYMWLLFSLNTGAPDTSIYEWIYNEGMRDAFEPLFTFLMLTCRSMGFSFTSFRMVEATLLLFFLNLTFRKINQPKTLAAAMYMIALFPWHVSGMRAALACVIMMYGMTFLFDRSKTNVKVYCIFLIMAVLVHYSSVLFSVMLLVKKDTKRINIVLYFIFVVIGILVVRYTDILLNLVRCFTSREKIITWLSGGIGKEGFPNLKGFSAELMILFGNIYLTQRSKKIVSRYDVTGSGRYAAKIISNLNIITILYIPFLRLNDTYMRLLYVVTGIDLVLYAMTAYIIREHRKKVRMCRGMKINVYILMVFAWMYVVAFYQTLPYLGTSSSVFVFLGENSMFP